MQSTENPLTLARFWSKVEVRRPSQCWPWRAFVNEDGYGQFWDGERLVRAHRFGYEAVVGDADGVLDHVCHNDSGCDQVPCAHRRCCNPHHLEAVRQAVNSQRGRTGEHQSRKTFCPSGHEYTEENTILRDGGRQRVCRTCNAASQKRYRDRKRGTNA